MFMILHYHTTPPMLFKISRTKFIIYAMNFLINFTNFINKSSILFKSKFTISFYLSNSIFKFKLIIDIWKFFKFTISIFNKFFTFSYIFSFLFFIKISLNKVKYRISFKKIIFSTFFIISFSIIHELIKLFKKRLILSSTGSIYY